MKTNIMGTAVATVQQMQSYIQKVNPAVPKSVIDMVEYYISEGKTEGVDGLPAVAESGKRYIIAFFLVPFFNCTNTFLFL